MNKKHKARIVGPALVGPKVDTGAKKEFISVSLKYWHAGSQCISDWPQHQLKSFRRTIEKLQNITPAELRNHDGLKWKPHNGKPGAGFTRPNSLSPDIPLGEVRVDAKARLHGAVRDDTFFLVWLDRNHAVFP